MSYLLLLKTQVLVSTSKPKTASLDTQNRSKDELFQKDKFEVVRKKLYRITLRTFFRVLHIIMYIYSSQVSKISQRASKGNNFSYSQLKCSYIMKPSYCTMSTNTICDYIALTRARTSLARSLARSVVTKQASPFIANPVS